VKTIIKKIIIIFLSYIGKIRLKFGNNYLIVLMYHRVLPKNYEKLSSVQPGMYVTPQSLKKHIQLISEYVEIVHLDRYLEDMSAGRKVPSRACAITFDDGWKDNYQYGFDVLKETKSPASIYLVSEMIGSNEHFWPEEITRLCHSILENTRLGFEKHESYQWLMRIGFDTELDLSDNIKVQNCMETVINNAKEYPENIIIEYINEIKKYAKIKEESDSELLSWDEVNEMKNSGLLCFGSHTKNHVRLNDNIDLNIMVEEIRDSKRMIDEKLGQNTSLFCFPNGDMCKQALELAEKYYEHGLTTERGINRKDLQFLLKRIGMHEDMANTEEKFFAKLSGVI